MNTENATADLFNLINGQEVVRVATEGCVFIAHMANGWRKLGAGVKAIEMYVVDENGLEEFAGYAEGARLAALAGPMGRAARGCLPKTVDGWQTIVGGRPSAEDMQARLDRWKAAN